MQELKCFNLPFPLIIVYIIEAYPLICIVNNKSFNIWTTNGIDEKALNIILIAACINRT